MLRSGGCSGLHEGNPKYYFFAEFLKGRYIIKDLIDCLDFFIYVKTFIEAVKNFFILDGYVGANGPGQ